MLTLVCLPLSSPPKVKYSCLVFKTAPKVRQKKRTFPWVAQRDAFSRELALGLPLTNCHLSALELHPRCCKQTGNNSETACAGHQRNTARLL